MFLRRLGKNNQPECAHGLHCPQVLEKLDGNFAVVGKVITQEAREALPPGAGISPSEAVVEVPREVLLAALSDFFVKAA